MKIHSLILSVIVVILFVVSSFSVRAQQIIRTIDGDTLVTITPPQLRTINCIIVDYEYRGIKINNLESSNSLLFQKSTLQDSIISQQNLIMDQQMEIYVRNTERLREDIKNERKKGIIIGGVSGVVLGALIILLVGR